MRLFIYFFVISTAAMVLLVGCASNQGDEPTPIASLPTTTTTIPNPAPTPAPATTSPAFSPASPTSSVPTQPLTTPSPLPTVDNTFIANPAFNIRQAKTDTHFFFTYENVTYITDYGLRWTRQLFCVPLDNIAHSVEIPLPGEGTIDIVGMCTQYLYVSRRFRNDWSLDSDEWFYSCTVYRITLDTLQISEVVQYNALGAPFYHAHSHTLIAPSGNIRQFPWHLYAYCLLTEEWSFLINFMPHFEGGGLNWLQMENDSVLMMPHAFINNEEWARSVYINAALEATLINDWNITQTWRTTVTAQNAGEAYVMSLPLVRRSFATINDWVYFLQLESWRDEYMCLYRIRADGTDKLLLQNKSTMQGLYAFNNTLFATIFAVPEEQFDGRYLHAVLLSESFETLAHFGSGWGGQHTHFTIRAVHGTDLVVAVEGRHHEVFYHVLGLYCTRTGAVFTP